MAAGNMLPIGNMLEGMGAGTHWPVRGAKGDISASLLLPIGGAGAGERSSAPIWVVALRLWSIERSCLAWRRRLRVWQKLASAEQHYVLPES